jgi:hypothetical protein
MSKKLYLPSEAPDFHCHVYLPHARSRNTLDCQKRPESFEAQVFLIPYNSPL